MDVPKTKQGNKHVIVFQDFLTKWPMVFPFPDQKTRRIVRLLAEEIIPLFGVPEALLSDRGTNLLSYLMKEVCSLLGIEKLNTTAYNPQCNGLIEGFNRTLKTMLRKHAVKFGIGMYLYSVLWAYRNTTHELTHKKPSFLLFRTDCRYPTEAVLLPPTPIDLMDCREELILSKSSARKLVAEAMRAAQKKYKNNYDRTGKVRDYRIGDWILIRFPQEESGANWKLSRPWHGPFRVTDSDKTGVTAVKVYTPQENPIRVHQSRVTACPTGFPAGYWWYGNHRSGPGRPPKWIDRFLAAQGLGEGTDAIEAEAMSGQMVQAESLLGDTEPEDHSTVDARPEGSTQEQSTPKEHAVESDARRTSSKRTRKKRSNLAPSGDTNDPADEDQTEHDGVTDEDRYLHQEPKGKLCPHIMKARQMI